VSVTGRRAIVVVVVLGLAGGLVWWAVHQGTGSGSSAPTTTSSPLPDASAAARAYFDAWKARKWNEMAFRVVAAPPDFADQHQAVVDTLGVHSFDFAPGTPVVRRYAHRAPTADVPFEARYDLTGLGVWSFRNTLHLVDRGGSWAVRWSPRLIHPELAPDFALKRTRAFPTRAPILDMAGAPLVSSNPVVEVGVEPERIKSVDAVARALQQHLNVSRAQLDAALHAPGVRPNYFVTVADVAPAVWDQVKAAVLPVPGIIIRDATARQGEPPGWAKHVLGTVGEATAEQLARLGDPYAVGDVTGTGGIEEVYERRLAGTPTGEIDLVDEFGHQVGVLKRFAGRDPQPVRTTLDPAVQSAAESALSHVTAPVGLVAIDPRTGQIRAAASRPLEGFDRAFTGRYPPGSTMKLVTAYAALATGTTAATLVQCPSSITVGGKPFRNFEGEQFGTISFATAFEESCNTAFIGQAERMGSKPLSDAAHLLGFDVDYDAGLPVFHGSFPPVVDTTENAAAAIGQGRVEASAVQMASIGAALADGAWRPPTIVTDPAPHGTRRAHPLDPNVVNAERDLMLRVVQSGTGTAAAVPGRVVRGKTGTAQFDPRDPNHTHAWFVGYVERPTGPLAFAVIVEGGGVGGRVAAPIIHDFVAALPVTG
jgi:cell division protein FtsI/penicillin-binding protein 2